MTGSVYVPLGPAEGRDRWQVEHAGRVFAVFVLDGELVVTDGRCPHRQGALAEGWIRDGCIVCPSHWYTYDLATGECRTTDNYHLRRYPVVWRDGEAFAEVPVARRRSWSEILRSHVTAREG